MDELDDLVRRLDLLEAERAIIATIYQFGHSIDYGRDAEWVDCFVPDGVLVVDYGDLEPKRVAKGSRDGNRVTHSGAEQLAAFIAGHTRPPEFVHKHLYVEPRIEVTGDTATSITYMTRVDRIEGRAELLSFGRYHDRWRRCDDGRWRLVQRRIEVEAMRDVPSPYAPGS